MVMTSTERATRQRLRRFLTKLAGQLVPLGVREERIDIPENQPGTEGTLHLILLRARGSRTPPFEGSVDTIRVRLKYMALGGADRNAAAMGLGWEADTYPVPMSGILGNGGLTPQRVLLLVAAYHNTIDAPAIDVTKTKWMDAHHFILAPKASAEAVRANAERIAINHLPDIATGSAIRCLTDDIVAAAQDS